MKRFALIGNIKNSSINNSSNKRSEPVRSVLKTSASWMEQSSGHSTIATTPEEDSINSDCSQTSFLADTNSTASPMLFSSPRRAKSASAATTTTTTARSTVSPLPLSINNGNRKDIILQKKRVTFDETQNQRSRTAANTKYLKMAWYADTELLQSKKSAQGLAQQLRQSTNEKDESYRRVLVRVYGKCCQQAQEQEEAQQDDAASCFLDRKHQLDLKKCVSRSNSRFGLERMIVPDIAKDVRERHKRMLRRIQEISNATGAGSSLSEIMIAKSCASFSRPHTIWARTLANAVAGQDYDEMMASTHSTGSAEGKKKTRSVPPRRRSTTMKQTQQDLSSSTTTRSVPPRRRSTSTKQTQDLSSSSSSSSDHRTTSRGGTCALLAI